MDEEEPCPDDLSPSLSRENLSLLMPTMLAADDQQLSIGDSPVLVSSSVSRTPLSPFSFISVSVSQCASPQISDPFPASLPLSDESLSTASPMQCPSPSSESEGSALFSLSPHQRADIEEEVGEIPIEMHACFAPQSFWHLFSRSLSEDIESVSFSHKRQMSMEIRACVVPLSFWHLLLSVSHSPSPSPSFNNIYIQHIARKDIENEFVDEDHDVEKEKTADDAQKIARSPSLSLSFSRSEQRCGQCLSLLAAPHLLRCGHCVCWTCAASASRLLSRRAERACCPSCHKEIAEKPAFAAAFDALLRAV